MVGKPAPTGLNSLINPPSFADLHQHLTDKLIVHFDFWFGGGGFTRLFILGIDGW